MEKGDFVAVHTDSGCIVGKFYSDDGDVCSIDFGKDGIAYGVPKGIVTLYVKVGKETD